MKKGSIQSRDYLTVGCNVVVVVDLVVLVHRHAITLQTTVEYINIDITNDLMLQIYYRVANTQWVSSVVVSEMELYTCSILTCKWKR